MCGTYLDMQARTTGDPNPTRHSRSRQPDSWSNAVLRLLLGRWRSVSQTSVPVQQRQGDTVITKHPQLVRTKRARPARLPR